MNLVPARLAATLPLGLALNCPARGAKLGREDRGKSVAPGPRLKEEAS